jgi:hypothetical protein
MDWHEAWVRHAIPTAHKPHNCLSSPVSCWIICVITSSSSRDSSAGIAASYLLDSRGIGDWFLAATKYVFPTSSGPALGPTQPPIQWVPGALSPGREADHSPPSSAEVKRIWIHTSTSPWVLMAWCLIKQRDNFTVTLQSPFTLYGPEFDMLRGDGQMCLGDESSFDVLPLQVPSSDFNYVFTFEDTRDRDRKGIRN